MGAIAASDRCETKRESAAVDTSSLGLVTPTYWRDLERCALLCESVDRHVTSFAKHYLLVADDDLALFAHFKSTTREVIPLSQVLPSWLKPLPRFVRRRQRHYWWSRRALPVSGWHVQQFAKILAASRLSHPRTCILDSDVVFFRPFDVRSYAKPNPTPLFVQPQAIAADAPLHAAWIRSSHRLLGLVEPAFPADDFIGHIIFWDRRTVLAMIERIEQATGREWIEALCRERHISEYLLYGNFVRDASTQASEHRSTNDSPCLSYWGADALDDAAMEGMLRSVSSNHVAFSATSFSGTPVERVRAALAQHAERNQQAA